MMTTRRAVIGLGIAGIAVVASAKIWAVNSAPSAEAQMQKINGKVMYRERMLLPEGAKLEVSLADVSLADAPAEIIAKLEKLAGQASPIDYELDYDPAKIIDGRRYVLQAKISHADELIFINDTAHQVFEGDKSDFDILVVRASAKPEVAETASGLYATWKLQEITGATVNPALNSQVTIEASGNINGSGGCNRLTGTAQISGDKLRVGPMGVTMMACDTSTMDQERNFHAALDKVRSFEVQDDGAKLVLMGEDGKALLIFSKA